MLLGLRRRPRGLFRRASRLRPVRCAATLVTDPEDERLALYSMKSVRRFKQYESQRRRLLSEYPEYNVAVHSSRKVVEKLVDHWQTAPEDVVIHSFLTSAALYDQISHFVHRPGVPVFVVDKEMVDEVVGLRHRRQNAVFALVSHPRRVDPDTLTPPILVLDNVSSSENLGAILRTAAGLGVFSILATPVSFNGVNSRAARASAGNLYKCQYACATDLQRHLTKWRDEGLSIFAADEAGDITLQQAAASGCAGGKWVLVVGAERGGVSGAALDIATTVRIPQMSGDTLNVGHAAAIVLYTLQSKVAECASNV
mmetsp:Transcript_119832/g.274523  ORF Transcript_119832/g.274523 Transcript_119832/m.274523 type:complete len:312 (+) Transcript_119832:60-995(+)